MANNQPGTIRALRFYHADVYVENKVSLKSSDGHDHGIMDKSLHPMGTGKGMPQGRFLSQSMLAPNPSPPVLAVHAFSNPHVPCVSNPASAPEPCQIMGLVQTRSMLALVQI